MKLNELKQIEEGIVSSIKGMFTGQGGYQTEVQDIFIKDFVQDALTSLNNGVKGGLVNPNAKTGAQAAAPAAGAPASVSGTATQQGQAAQAPLKATSTSVKFNGPGAPGAANAAPAAGQAGTQQQTQYMGKIAPNAGPATKPAAPASPFATPTLNQPKTTVSTTPGNKNSKPGAITTGGAGMTMKESAYDKMNRVFESIINIDEETQEAEARTVADFMMDWFTQYMEGVNWQSSKAIVQQKLDKLQAEYPKNVNQNLTDLARIGLALSKTGTPKGAPPEFTQAKKQMGNTITDLKAELDGLAKSDPKAYNELLKSLRPANVNPAG